MRKEENSAEKSARGRVTYLKQRKSQKRLRKRTDRTETTRKEKNANTEDPSSLRRCLGDSLAGMDKERGGFSIEVKKKSLKKGQGMGRR